MSLYRCAACGSQNVMVDTQSDGVQFNFGKAVAGTVAIGAGGAVAGIESKTQRIYYCPDCGSSLTYPMPADLKALIDIGVTSGEARYSLSWRGVRMDWEVLTAKYKNIESGLADHEAREREAQKNRTLLSAATASFDEFNKAFQFLSTHDFTLQFYHERKLPKSERVSADRPLTLPEYLSLISAVKTVVENMPKYLPHPLPERFQGITRFEMERLFPSYVCELILENGIQEDGTLPVLSRKSKLLDLSAYLRAFPYLQSWMELYDEDFSIGIRDVDSHLKMWHSVNPAFPYSPAIVREQQIDEMAKWLWNNMDAVLPLLPMRLDTIGEELLESFTGYIPRFFIKDGRLGYFDASYNEDKAKKLRIGDGLGTWVKDFLRQHPEEEKAILISLESFEAERRASEEKAAELERLKVESESAQEEINVAKVKIAENEREIEKLERKVLGKGKAREQINDLKACSLELDRDIEEQTKRIREYQKKERESHSDRIKGRDEFYAELIAKYNGFIPWTWVIEENAQDSSTPKIDDIADAGTPELKNMKNVDNIGVDPDVLRKWKSLLDDGLISKEEYAMKKKQILGL